MGTVYLSTVIELAQIVLGLCGVVFSSVALVRSMHIYRLVARLGIQNGRRIIASAHVRSEAFRLGAQMVVVLTGGVALTLPAPEPFMELALIEMIWARKLGLAFVALLMLASSIGDAVDRRLLDEVSKHA